MLMYFMYFVVCLCDEDGAPDPDAEPDERETDGHADRLVQGVCQILRHLLYPGLCGTHSRVSFVLKEVGSEVFCSTYCKLHPEMINTHTHSNNVQ